jgi:hypothetical protein
VDLSELIKGGGSVKCCTQEIRPAPIAIRGAASLSDDASSLVSENAAPRPAHHTTAHYPTAGASS